MFVTVVSPVGNGRYGACFFQLDEPIGLFLTRLRAGEEHEKNVAHTAGRTWNYRRGRSTNVCASSYAICAIEDACAQMNRCVSYDLRAFCFRIR